MKMLDHAAPYRSSFVIMISISSFFFIMTYLFAYRAAIIVQ